MTALFWHCLYIGLFVAAGLIVAGLMVIGYLDRRDEWRRDREIDQLNALYHGDSAVAPEPRRQP